MLKRRVVVASGVCDGALLRWLFQAAAAQAARLGLVPPEAAAAAATTAADTTTTTNTTVQRHHNRCLLTSGRVLPPASDALKINEYRRSICEHSGSVL
jgi:hypothetical protein